MARPPGNSLKPAARVFKWTRQVTRFREPARTSQPAISGRTGHHGLRRLSEQKKTKRFEQKGAKEEKGRTKRISWTRGSGHVVPVYCASRARRDQSMTRDKAWAELRSLAQFWPEFL